MSSVSAADLFEKSEQPGLNSGGGLLWPFAGEHVESRDQHSSSGVFLTREIGTRLFAQYSFRLRVTLRSLLGITLH